MATVTVSLPGRLLAKVAYEVLAGDAVFASAAGWIRLPVAHVVGIFAGALVCLPLPLPLSLHPQPMQGFNHA